MSNKFSILVALLQHECARRLSCWVKGEATGREKTLDSRNPSFTIARMIAQASCVFQWIQASRSVIQGVANVSG